MTDAFFHIGRFVVSAEQRSAFIDLMQAYEAHARQQGLDHSHLVEDERSPGTFMHVTLWSTRDHWMAVERSDEHKEMHEKRNVLLAEPMQHDFVAGPTVY